MKTKTVLQITGLLILIMSILSCASTWIYKNNTTGIIGDFEGFSPDGKQLVTKTGNNSIKLWDIETEREIRTFENKSMRFKGFSPDGKLIVTSVYSAYWGRDDSLILWDVESGREIRIINGINMNFGGFSPDGKLLITNHKLSMHYNEYRLWDVTSGEIHRLFNLVTYYNLQQPIHFLSDSKQMYLCMHNLMRWNIDITNNNNAFALFNGKNITNDITSFAIPALNYISISPDEKYFFSHYSGYGLYGTVDLTHFTIQDFKTGEKLFNISNFHYDHTSVHLNWETKQLYALIGTLRGSDWNYSNKNYSLYQWDISYGTNNIVPFNSYKKSFYIGKVRKDSAYPLITPDGKYILITDQNNVITLRDIENGNVIKTFTGHTKRITSLYLVPNSERFITISKDKTIRIWDF